MDCVVGLLDDLNIICRIPCIRTEPSDPKFYIVHAKNVISAPTEFVCISKTFIVVILVRLNISFINLNISRIVKC